MRNRRKTKARIIFVAVMIPTIATVFAAKSISALTEKQEEEFAQNNILFFDPTECSEQKKGGSSASVSVHPEDLPAETVQIFENEGLKDKAQRNIERYMAGGEAAGIPWQAVAALHYREAGMNPESSMSNGAKLGSGINVDGVDVQADPNVDAINMAKLLVNNGKGVYNVDITDPEQQTLEAYGKAFLSYNRGYMYVNAGVDWKESPYPMNYLTEENIKMKFPCNASEPSSTRCKTNQSVGALAVMIYLGGFDGSNPEGQNVTTSTSTTGSDITLIGDSISNGMREKIKAVYPDADLYTQGNKIFTRRPESGVGGAGGLTILEKLKDESKIRKTLIYLLGTNESTTTRADVDEVLELAGNSDKIIFATLYDQTSVIDYDNFNTMIKEVEKEDDRVVVIDWKAAAEKDPAKYINAGDNVHPTAEGQDLYIELIKKAVGSRAENTTDKDDSCGCTKKAYAKIEGGLNEEQYNKLAEFYAKDDYNDKIVYSAGKKNNCVTLSNWFLSFFTTVDGKSPLLGGDRKECKACVNGVMVADYMAKNYNLPQGNEPRPFAVFSVSGPIPHISGGDAGHTGVVMAIEGDTLITLNSAWDSTLVYIQKMPISQYVNNQYSYVYTYLDDVIDREALAVALGETIETTTYEQKEGAQVATSDVVWEDGWISSGLEGFEKYAITESGDSSNTQQYSTEAISKDNEGPNPVGPNKITLHTTEGWYTGDKYTYSNTMFPPHFTIDMVNKKVWQHYTINQPSNAVKDHDTSAGIQIEIVGFSGEAYKDDEHYMQNGDTFGKDEWAYLAKLLSAISAQTNIPITSSVNWENPERLSVEEFKNYKGILAHMHVPDNDHTDTGNIWPMLSEALGSTTKVQTGECKKKGPNPFDFPFYNQYDPKWADVVYGGCGSIGQSGCGPSSLAMMISSLLGEDITPDKVVAVTGDQHDCVNGGSKGTLPVAAAEHFDIDTEVATEISEDAFNKHLRDGWMIWTCGRGPDPYTQGGHCIGIRGLMEDTGRWLIADSNGEAGRKNTLTRDFAPEELLAHNNGFATYIRAKNGNVGHTVFRSDWEEGELDTEHETDTPGLKEGTFEDWKYWLYEPEEIVTTRPLIVYLHGNYTQGQDLNNLLTDGGFAQHIKDGASYNAYILMPLLPRDSWTSGNHTKILFDLIDKVVDEYDLNPRAVHLSGFSMGANEAAYIVANNPDRFASLTTMAIAWTPGSESNLKDIPTRVYCGRDDNPSNVAACEPLVNKINNAGGDAEMFWYPSPQGHAHLPKKVLDDTDSRWVDWMLRQHK